MSEPKPFGVTLQRTATGRYVATNARGVQLELGSDDDVFSPVEVLLAAIGAWAYRHWGEAGRTRVERWGASLRGNARP